MNTEDIIVANRRLVHLTAKKFGDMSKDEDLLQCGLIGLWKAAETWEGKGPFATYAIPCIEHAMIDYLRSRKPRETTADYLEEEGAEDEKDLLVAIKEAFPAGSVERDILFGLMSGKTKTELAQKHGMSRKTITRIAINAWERLNA